ncbi:MAG: hypothetical protein U0797_15545 [Gemmataceae bacterium]
MTNSQITHAARLDRLRDAVAGVLLGKPEGIQLALVALLADGHLLIEDVPGIGKTLLAKAAGPQPRLHVPPHSVHA